MPQTYGKSLPDQYERIASLIGTHLEVVSDVREFYRDRVALEREYASKLQILAKRAAEKKAKVEAFLVFGAEPTKTWDDAALKQSTLNLAYDEIINSAIKTAQDHVNLAEVLTSQTVSDLKTLETRKAETKKKRMLFFQRLLSDKDRTNVERQKAKTKYDEECAEVEAYRHKQGRSHDDRHADRIARQSEQQRNDMLNSKNLYLISTAVANATKDKFYSEDLPALEDQFQMIQTRLVKRFSKILLHAQALQMSHMDTLKSRLANVERCLNDIDPAKDQDIFIEYNIRPFTPPIDWKFDPCATFYDTGVISVEPAPKIFLQNKLSKSQSKLGELEPLIANKRRESDQLANLVSAYTEDPSLGNLDEVSDSYFDARHQLTLFTTSENILKTEIATMLDALGDDIGEQQPHSFKSSSFSIPTTCGYCKTSIWGLSKQGKTCKACGLSVHSKCELKVPADCQTGSQSSLKPVGSRLSTLATPNKPTPTASSFVQSVPEQEVDYPIARILFQFAATSEFELSISEGDSVRVLEPDDGSGWVKVLDHQGQDGLVPASYLAYEEDPPVGGEQDSGHHVRALYTYEARGSDEIDLAEGDMIELSSGPNGGRNYGDSWWEGTNPRGEKGIFPSNYVQAV